MLAGKVAWITGGGSGIGLAGAIELSRAGAHVVISGRSKETLATAEKQLKAAGKGEALAVDVTDKAEVAKIAAARSEEHTTELQSRLHHVCRLLLAHKKIQSCQCQS